MDCHVFRRLCDELAPALMGCRMRKNPPPGQGCDPVHALRHSRQTFPVFFARAARLPSFSFRRTKSPSAAHRRPISCGCANTLPDRRIIDVLPDWVGRRLYLHVNADTECWLTLDLREGPSLLFDTPPEPEIPAWPDPAHWAEACEGDGWRELAGHHAALAPYPPFAPARRTSRPAPRSGGRRRRSFPLRERRRGTRAFRSRPAAQRRRDADGTPREELVVEDAIRRRAQQPGKRKSCAASRPSLGPKRPNPIRPRPTACANSCSSWRAKKNASATWLRHRMPPACSNRSFTVFLRRKNTPRHAGRGRRACRSCPRSPPHRP